MKLNWLPVFLYLFVIVSRYACAEVTIFQDGSSLFSMGLADGDKIILPPHYWIEEDEYSFYFTAGIDGSYGFYDKASGCLHPAEYDFVGDDFFTDIDAPVLVGKNGYYGYVYRDKCEIAIPMIYQSYGEYSQFENGYAIIGKGPFTLAGGSRFVLINLQGNEIIFPGDYEPISLPTSDGLLILIDPVTGLLGIGNTTGNVVVLPAYEGIGGIHEGYISYCVNGRWGHMDTSGTIILPPTYELYYDWEDIDCPWGYHFEDGVATLLIVTDDGGWHEIKIDYEGNCIP